MLKKTALNQTLHRLRFLWLLLSLEILHFVIRWILIHSPFFTQLDYDESIVGLMALHILRGEPQLMLWGQPRMGGLEANLASFLFYLFGPSTKIIQLSLIIISSVMLLVIFSIGKKAAGTKTGLIAAGFWALPPIFLSFTGNYVTGGHLESVLFGALLLYGGIQFCEKPFSHPAVLILLMGLLAGIGFWSSLLIIPFLVAVGLAISGYRPKFLFSTLPWIGIGGYLLGSLPFWVWNAQHNFDTLIHLGGKNIKDSFFHLPLVFWGTLPTLVGTFWDGQKVSSSILDPIGSMVLIAGYLPVFIITLGITLRWLDRIRRKDRPLREPLDCVVLLFLFYFFVRATGELEDLGLTRYTIVLFVPLTVLMAHWVTRLLAYRKIIGFGLLFILLAFNLMTQYGYLKLDKGNPVRPVDPLISAFQKAGIRYCYGDNRVTQVVTFESQEKIIAADYFGTRNYEYLKMVDQAPVREVALLSHNKLGDPFPTSLEGSLQLLGGSFRKGEVDDYVFWYDLKEPAYRLRSLPANPWKITSSHEGSGSSSVKDRDIFTAWRTVNQSGEWLQVDLGQRKWVAQVSLLPGPVGAGLPTAFRLEISDDGKAWQTLREIKDYAPGFYWYRGRPKRDANPRLQIMFPPKSGRFLRIVNLTEAQAANPPWSIAELFIYEILDREDQVPKKTREVLARAEKELAHWQEDPTGPHPLIKRVSLNFRREKVRWPAVIRDIFQALRDAPDWEEAHQLLVEAVSLGDLLKPGEGGKGEKLKNTLDLLQKDPGKIESRNWVVSANVNNNEACLAVDGNPMTRWSSLKNQQPDQVFQLDLGRNVYVNSFALLFGTRVEDYPRGLKVLGSVDGRDWSEIKVFPKSYYCMVENRIYKKTYYIHSPLEVRFLKMIQTGADPIFWWSIYEIDVFNHLDFRIPDDPSIPFWSKG
jgi:hypothetical protein